MTGGLLGAVLRSRSLILLGSVTLVAFGALALRSLPSGIYPEVDFPRVVVVARAGDLPPGVMVAATTRPLEEALAVTPGLVRLRSRTTRGACEISVQFAAGTDMIQALQRVETHVAEVHPELPDGTTVQVERVTATALPILTFNVAFEPGPAGERSARADAPEVARARAVQLRDFADRILRPALTRVPGIGTVEVQGGDVREFEVILKPAALAAAHLTPSMVADRLTAQDVTASVGRVVDLRQSLTVLLASEAHSVAELAALPVASGPHGALPLAQVAEVVEGAEDRTVAISGRQGDLVVVTVSRAPGASAPQVVDAAQAAVDTLRAAHAFPRGVQVEVVYDQSELVRDSLRGVRDAIGIGVLLSLLVLAVFLRDVRAGAAAAIAVPVTLVGTFGAMRLWGETLNLMSLGGLAIAIGLVVDDAIVIVEAIVRRREGGASGSEAAEAGTRDLFAAVVGTTLTTVVVFAPLAFLEGVVGNFFGALAATLCAAVLLSLVVSVTLVPVTAARLLKAGRTTTEGHRASRLERAYGNLVRRWVKHPVLGLLAILLLAGAGVVASTHLSTGFLPSMDEGAFVLDFELPPGTSLDETDRVARKIDHILATEKAIVAFTRRTGAEMGPATATQQNSGDILARLVPRDQRGSFEEVTDTIRERVAEEAPEARIEFVQVLQDVLDDLAGNPRPVEVRIFGDDPALLDVSATLVADRLETLSELVDLSPGVEGNVPVLQANLNAHVAIGLGVSPADVARDLQVALTGLVVAQARVEDRLIGVRVRMPDAARFDADAVAALPLAYGAGSIRLDTVAPLARPRGPAVIQRENLRSMALITAAVRGDDLGGATDAVRRRLDGLKLPPGYTYEVGGQAEAAAQTRWDLGAVFGTGIILVLAILLVQLKSLRLALVVLACAPLAVVGAVITLAATGIPLNASSLMGCVLLAGLVVKNGILLLEQAVLWAPDLEGGFEEAIARAGERRLRPILMTTAATLAGLLPLALGLGAGSELQRPLALATIGGLALSTVVTLLALPALASALMRGRAAPHG